MKKILASILTLCVALTLCAPMTAGGGKPNALDVANPAPLAEEYVGADFRGGEIAYQLDDAIPSSINTFEACIRLDYGTHTKAQNSIIFGNYNKMNARNDCNTYSNFEINADGNVVVNWACSEHVFTDVDVRTGEWLHLAVVRDPEQKTLSLYLNGALMQTLQSYPEVEITGNIYRHRIGGDLIEGKKSPFWGEIGHVACYGEPRSAQEIYADYTDVSAINYFTRGDDLVYSCMLSLGSEIIPDTSKNFNTARLVTNDYFYDTELFEVGDYSIAALGDTQRIAQFGGQSCYDISDWLIDHVADRKIGMSIYLGDMTGAYIGTPMPEWDRMMTVISGAVRKLDGKVPYHLIPGNHDYNENSTWRDLDKYNEYFPASAIATDFNGYVGAYEEGYTQNTYYTARLGGVDYLFLALEFGPDRDVMQWACDVMQAHPNHRVVVSTHGFINTAGELYTDDEYLSADQYWSLYNRDVDATSAQEMWDKYLSNHENLFMILCGHSTTESVGYKALKGKHGNTTMAFRLDPSYVASGMALDSIIGLFQFHEATSTLTLNYFSAAKGDLYNVQNQMVVNFSDFTRLTHSYYTQGGIAR